MDLLPRQTPKAQVCMHQGAMLLPSHQLHMVCVDCFPGASITEAAVHEAGSCIFNPRYLRAHSTAGFASTTAGTAAVTGAFGAWGASAGGSSAGNLFADVKEFGFWDLSQSIWASGAPPAPAETAGAAETTGKGGVAGAAGAAGAAVDGRHSSSGDRSPSAAAALASQPGSDFPIDAAASPLGGTDAPATSAARAGGSAAAGAASAGSSAAGGSSAVGSSKGSSSGGGGSTGGGSSSGGTSSLTSWLWRRSTTEQKPAPPVLRPLLPIPVNPKRADHGRLALTVGVSGMVTEPEDFVKPWELLSGLDCERFGLVWETDILKVGSFGKEAGCACLFRP